jgi:hypothetical protein
MVEERDGVLGLGDDDRLELPAGDPAERAGTGSRQRDYSGDS